MTNTNKLKDNFSFISKLGADINEKAPAVVASLIRFNHLMPVIDSENFSSGKSRYRINPASKDLIAIDGRMAASPKLQNRIKKDLKFDALARKAKTWSDKLRRNQKNINELRLIKEQEQGSRLEDFIELGGD